MTIAAFAFAALFAVAAPVDWWSRWTGERRLERITKPVALVALIGVAVTIDPTDAATRAWFVAALCLSLAGDVFLLDDDRFVQGLASFLLAHIAFTVGFVVAPDWAWGWFAVAAALVAILGVTVGARIVAGARRRSNVLGPAVIAYLVAISAMAAAAAASGNAWAILGAALFVASDALLGWRQFVRSVRWMSPAVMVTYHLGQAGLVVSLLER
jgi:uncharacterized membrane protein YhhN